jgi:ABC-type multidrug transport system ATPase subunit
LTAVGKLNVVKANSIHVFLGQDGAGKTTMITILVRLQRPNEGFAPIFGKQVSEDKLKIGFMPGLQVFENSCCIT